MVERAGAEPLEVCESLAGVVAGPDVEVDLAGDRLEAGDPLLDERCLIEPHQGGQRGVLAGDAEDIGSGCGGVHHELLAALGRRRRRLILEWTVL